MFRFPWKRRHFVTASARCESMPTSVFSNRLSIFRTYPLFSRVFVFIAAPLAAVVVYVYHLLLATLPQIDGQIAVAGLSAPVSIHRDSHGVPTIESKTDNDAFFAVGYAHAQDRLWQLELQRRTAYGRLSELFGRDSIQQDVWFRTLGFRRLAESSWSSLSAQAQASLKAYAAGINAAVAAKRDLPVEFRLLGVEPEPWTVYDSLACMKLFALSLGLNYQSEIRHMLATRLLDAQKAQLFLPDDSSSGPATAPEVESGLTQTLADLLGLQKELELRLSIGGAAVGSNAWVVSGRHTRTGQPMLANDPHLGLQIPSQWYALRVRGPNLDVAGMSLVGLPVVVLGRNEHIAWGATNLMADVQDLYFEQPSSTDPTKYRSGDEWKQFGEHEEVIEVRADVPAFLHERPQPVRLRVRSSAHGPIVSDLFDILPQPVALRWVALDPNDTSYEAFFRLNFAQDWSAFQQALGSLVAPALTVLYADIKGNIGMLGAGRIPIREHGEGILPAAGWSRAYDWRGYIPAHEMPRAFNPPQGYIVSANNKIIGADYKYLISHEWAAPARALRIDQLLRERLNADAKLTLDDMARVQTDVVDLQALEFLPELLAVKPRNDRQAEAILRLKRWTGEMSIDSVGASIFHAWMRHLRIDLFSDDLKLDWSQRGQAGVVNELLESVDADRLRAALNSSTVDWCSDSVLQRTVSCEDVLRGSLDSALRELAKLTGSEDMEDWAWGQVHQARYAHVPFGQSRILKSFFNRRIAAGGSTNSINVSTAAFQDNEGYRQTLGPSTRQIMDVGEGRAMHMYMSPTGQSGNVMDAHYDDMLTPFRNGRYFDLASADGSDSRLLQLKPGLKLPPSTR